MGNPTYHDATATTSGCSTMLPRLALTALHPPSPPKSTPSHEAAAALHCVLRISVREAVDSHDYALQVFLRSCNSRLPRAVLPGSSTEARLTKSQPDLVVAYRFSVFRKLREDVYLAVQEGHGRARGFEPSCSFCVGVVDAMLLGETQPHRYDAWFRRSSDVCSRLEGFLQDLLARARGDRGGSAVRRPRCVAQIRVRTLLAEFLQLASHATTA